MPDTGPDHLDLSDLDLGGIDPDNVYVLHSHNNPQTGATAFSSSWPCPQCIALGRTEPLKYGRDVPNYPTVTSAEVPPERLEAYLASFDAPTADTPPPVRQLSRPPRRPPQG